MSEPTRPGEVPDTVSLGELAGHVDRHTLALAEHRCGITVRSDAERAGHCLAELAYSATLAERVLFRRWVVAVEALGAGESPERVAAAMGLDLDELHSGLHGWAHRQRRRGLIDADRHAQVLALLDSPVDVDVDIDLPTRQLRRFAVLCDALGDPPTSVAERASLLILAREDETTVRNLAAVIRRARGAER